MMHALRDINKTSHAPGNVKGMLQGGTSVLPHSETRDVASTALEGAQILRALLAFGEYGPAACLSLIAA